MLPTCSPLSFIFKNLHSLLYLSLTYLSSPRPFSPSLSHLFSPRSIDLIVAAHCKERRPAPPILSRALLTLFFSFGSSFSSMWIMRVLLGAILSALRPRQRPPRRAAALSVRLCFGSYRLPLFIRRGASADMWVWGLLVFPTAIQPIQAHSWTIEEASISAWYIDCKCPGENNLLPTLAGGVCSVALRGCPGIWENTDPPAGCLGSIAFLSPCLCPSHLWRGGGTLLGEGGKRRREALLGLKSTAPRTSLCSF